MSSQTIVKSVADMRVELLEVLRTAAADLRAIEGVDQLLGRACVIINALPFSSSEYLSASDRLRNARHYANLREPAAARYELQMLLRTFRHADSPFRSGCVA